MDESVNRFPYKPLPRSSASEIRILRLLPAARFNDEIRCVLEHVTLDTTKYHALSYVWGDPMDTRPIRLAYRDPDAPSNQAFASFPKDICEKYLHKRLFHTFQVTSNLECALRHLRHKGRVFLIWADAISINQADIEERGHEVQHMGRIYAGASEVIVWLGPYRMDGDPGRFHPLNQTTGQQDPSIAAHSHQGAANRPDEVNEISAEQAITSAFEWCRTIFNKFGELTTESARESYRNPELFTDPESRYGLRILCRRPWFKRLWVLQEVALGKGTVRAVCGLDSISFTCLTNTLPSLTSYALRFESKEHALAGMNPWFLIEAYKAVKSDTFGQCNVAEKLISILLMAGWALSASDPRDTVYAVLGMIGNIEGITVLQPNYKKPLDDFYLEVAGFLVKETGAMLLRAAPGDRATLPSWVPTWDQGVGNHRPDPKFCARCKAVAHPTVSACGRRLTVQAVCLGRISALHDFDYTQFHREDAARQYLIGLEKGIEPIRSAVRDNLSLKESDYGLGGLLACGAGFLDSREDLCEQYEIFMGRSTWPGRLKIRCRTAREEHSLFLERIRNAVERGWKPRQIVVMSSGYFGHVDDSLRLRLHNTIYFVPGCLEQLAFERLPEGYSLCGRIEVFGFGLEDLNDWYPHLEFSERKDLAWEDITIV